MYLQFSRVLEVFVIAKEEMRQVSYGPVECCNDVTQFKAGSYTADVRSRVWEMIFSVDSVIHAWERKLGYCSTNT